MNTRKLFLSLLGLSHCKTVCDVGSMDGAEALQFAQTLPQARVVALEANRENYQAIIKDPRIRSAGVEVRHQAAADSDGEASFHVADVDYASKDANRGESSLLAGYSRLKRVDRVQTTRLDTLLSGSDSPVALWIDVEGAAHQVVCGMTGIVDRVRLIHIEVDLVQYWPDEVLGEETRKLIKSLGFREIASQFYPDGPGAPGWQDEVGKSARRSELFDTYIAKASGNVVYVSNDWFADQTWPIRLRTALAKARAATSRLVARA